MSEKRLVEQWNAVRQNRFIRTCSSATSVKTQSDEAFRTIFEVVIPRSLVCRGIFYQSQSSSRDQDENCLFLFFPVTRCHSSHLFYFLHFRANSFSLMNCVQCQLNQEGNELLNSSVFWVVSFIVLAITIWRLFQFFFRIKRSLLEKKTKCLLENLRSPATQRDQHLDSYVCVNLEGVCLALFRNS